MAKKSSVIIKNLLWKFMERMSSQLVSFIISLVLARLLMPQDYGTVAIVNVLIAICNTIVTSGFGTSLIQKKDTDELDYSSVFYFNMILSIVLYFILFSLSKWIAGFYGIEDLYIYIRVLGIQIIIYSLNIVQNAYVSKHLMFKYYFFATLFGNILSGIAGILMAVLGYGIWALIVQSLMSSIINALVLWNTVKWRPVFKISFRRLKELFGFGSKMLMSAFLSSMYEQVTNLVIGRVYSSSDLAYYNRGQNYPSLLVTNINSSINTVLFPVISDVQDNKNESKMIMRKGIHYSSFILFPALIGLAVVAEPLVKILLTDKWLPSVIFIQLFCVYYLICLIQNIRMSTIQATGDGITYVCVELFKDIVGIVLLVIMFKHSVEMVAISVLSTTAIISFITCFIVKNKFNYTFSEQLKDILIPLSGAGIMGVVVYLISFLEINIYLIFTLQIIVGILVYVLYVCCLKDEAYIYLMERIKDARKKRKH